MDIIIFLDRINDQSDMPPQQDANRYLAYIVKNTQKSLCKFFIMFWPPFIFKRLFNNPRYFFHFNFTGGVPAN